MFAQSRWMCCSQSRPISAGPSPSTIVRVSSPVGLVLDLNSRLAQYSDGLSCVGAVKIIQFFT